MRVVAHLDRSELDSLISDVDSLTEKIGGLASTLDSMTEHLWKVKQEARAITLAFEEEETEDELHG